MPFNEMTKLEKLDWIYWVFTEFMSCYPNGTMLSYQELEQAQKFIAEIKDSYSQDFK